MVSKKKAEIEARAKARGQNQLLEDVRKLAGQVTQARTRGQYGIPRVVLHPSYCVGLPLAQAQQLAADDRARAEQEMLQYTAQNSVVCCSMLRTRTATLLLHC